MSDLPVHIRWMIRSDMAEVLDIEQEAFEFPWRPDQFRGCQKRLNCIRMVALSTEDDRVVGYMVYELTKTRLRLLSLAVAPDLWRRGVGRQMIEKLIGKLGTHRKSILMMIGERNLRGQLFFREMGFRCRTIVRQPFVDSDEDRLMRETSRRLRNAAEAAGGE